MKQNKILNIQCLSKCLLEQWFMNRKSQVFASLEQTQKRRIHWPIVVQFSLTNTTTTATMEVLVSIHLLQIKTNYKVTVSLLFCLWHRSSSNKIIIKLKKEVKLSNPLVQALATTQTSTSLKLVNPKILKLVHILPPMEQQPIQ